MMSRTALAWVIAVWATVSWGGRVVIIFDTGSDPWDRIRIGASVLTAVVAVASLWMCRWEPPALFVYAAVAFVVWGRSVVSVLAGDHSAGFVAVHLVLATVSFVIAGMAVVNARRFR